MVDSRQFTGRVWARVPVFIEFVEGKVTQIVATEKEIDFEWFSKGPEAALRPHVPAALREAYLEAGPALPEWEVTRD